MKQLTCEMCGSTDLIKQDGVFVCQSCGCKYSVEEARRMMIEGTVEVQGTVKVDSSPQVSNYLRMAENALSNNNDNVAEGYADRLLELDPANWKGWYIKGHAAGWQSTLGNVRYSEALLAFTNALMNVPDNEKEALTAKVTEDVQGLYKALMVTRLNRFPQWPDADEVKALRDMHLSMLQDRALFDKNTGIAVDFEEIDKALGEKINNTIPMAITKTINNDWRNATDVNSRTVTSITTYVDRVYSCISLSEFGAALWDTCEGKIKAYSRIIQLSNRLLNNRRPSGKGIFNENGIRMQNERIAKYEKEIKELRETYWAEHVERRAELDAKIAEITAKKEALEKELKSIPEVAKKEEIEAKISELQKEFNALSIFKSKEKKMVQSQLDDLRKQLSSLEEAAKEKAEPLKDLIEQHQETIEILTDFYDSCEETDFSDWDGTL